MFDIYVISLKKDKYRRDILKVLFPLSYDRFKFIEAVNREDIDINFYFEKLIDFEKEYKRLMTPSEMGCTLSHIKALEEFIKSGKKHALILEDDIIGNDQDIEDIEKTVLSIEFNGIVLCGGQEGLPPDWGKFRYGTKIAIAPNLFESTNYSIGFFSRAACYIVDRSFALHYIEKNSKKILLADDWVKYFNDTNYTLYFKKWFSHPINLSSSNIEDQRLLVESRVNRLNIIKNIFWVKFFKKINNFYHLFIFKLKGLVRIE